MRSTLFSASLVNLMGETGFSLFPEEPKTYSIKNIDTVYRLRDFEGYWVLERSHKGDEQKETLVFRTLYELEQYLIFQLRKLSRYRELDTRNG